MMGCWHVRWGWLAQLRGAEDVCGLCEAGVPVDVGGECLEACGGLRRGSICVGRWMLGVGRLCEDGECTLFSTAWMQCTGFMVRERVSFFQRQ